MILADSSVWIDHFRKQNPEMAALLLAEQIVMHPFMTVELALGSLYDRQARLQELNKLDRVTVADTPEVLNMIHARAIYSRGIGFVDAHLLASCLLTPGTRLWTRDGRLQQAAQLLGCEAIIK